jgi:hypothetical protein
VIVARVFELVIPEPDQLYVYVLAPPLTVAVPDVAEHVIVLFEEATGLGGVLLGTRLYVLETGQTPEL